ncbi:BACON domain-containing protein [Aestuariibaculum marinum]|uniref:BACON domain-containing protein n=1 Tax=Aestuariibaculum marinum TaxID=2683592 RepID=A0A8J6PYR3_9FLAO|nr:BACON domain-containing protein [Aestuariibaculum marinum]MBD0824932.1 BACON domain-containing protein [Aestuariibaculum marinum]
MKNLNIVFSNKALKLFALLAVLFVSVSCDNDDEITEEPYFTIEENPTGLSVDINGLTQSYVVRSNQPWKIVSQEATDWVKAFPSEGEDDGIFKFIVNENNTFDDRVVNFAFVVNGKEQPALFRIEQEANVPFIIVENSEAGVSVPSAGGEFQINLSANVDWAYNIVDGDWISEVEVTESAIKLSALKNRRAERTATLTVSSAEHPALTKTITITQLDGSIVIQEDFEWLAYGDNVLYITSSTGAVRMDSWTNEEMDRGWSSTPNTFSNNQRLVYARTGFVSLGKTKYGGDLISPKFEVLDGETTVKVTFKAAPYQTKGGTQDDNILNISVVGPGTPSVESLIIDNWPDYEADPNCTEIWKAPSAIYSFTITGATAETQLKLLGGDYNLDGVGKGKNRIFLDDIKVEIIE